MAFGARRGGLTGNANSITNPFAISTGGPITVAVGDLVIAVCGEQTTRTVTACADNLGNSYTALTGGTDAGTSTCRAFFARVANNGSLSSVSFTATASSDNVAAVATVIEGPFTSSPLDANPAEITTDITSSFTCPATGTLAQAQEAVIAWAVATGSTVWAATSPNLLGDQIATQAVLHTLTGYQAVSATTTVSPAFTAGSNPTDDVLGTASFERDLSQPAPETKWPNPLAPKAAVDFRSWVQASRAILQPPEIQYMPCAVVGSDNPQTASQSTDLRSWISQVNLALTAVVPAPPFIRTDWPTSATPSCVDRTWINQAIRAEIVASPFVQSDWNNPSFPTRSIDRTWANPVAAAPPFVQSDWYKPSFPTRSIDRTWGNQAIRAQIVVAPFGQFDWPKPQTGLPSDIRTWLRSPQVPAPAVVTYMPCAVTEWGNPALGQRAADGWVNQAIRAAVVVAPPFVQSDWSKPSFPTRSIDRTWVNQVAVAPPFVQSDWGNPSFSTRSIDRTWVNQAIRAVVVASPFVQSDWSKPSFPTRSIDRTWVNQAIRAAVAAPFVQSDWSKPSFPTRSIDRTWSNSALAVTYVFRGPLIAPIRPGKAKVAYSWTQSRALLLPVVAPPPPSNYDWPRARGPIPTDLRTWLQSPQVPAPVVVEYSPCVVTEWGNPAFGRRAADSWVNQAIRAAVVASPFVQSEWGKPSLPGKAKVADSWTQSRALLLPVVSSPPPSNYDWPQARGARPTDLRTWLQSPKVPAPVVPPFVQSDWGQPSLPGKAKAADGWISQAIRAAVAAPPFVQSDWGNPALRRSNAAVRLVGRNVPAPLPPFGSLQKDGDPDYWKLPWFEVEGGTFVDKLRANAIEALEQAVPELGSKLERSAVKKAAKTVRVYAEAAGALLSDQEIAKLDRLIDHLDRSAKPKQKQKQISETRAFLIEQAVRQKQMAEIRALLVEQAISETHVSLIEAMRREEEAILMLIL